MSEERIDQIVQFYKNNTMFRLRRIVPIITERLEIELERNGIPARVAARVKKPASLRGKLIKWAKPSSEKKGRVTTPEATLLELSDLAAVRVMTYTESDRSRVHDLVTKIFKSPDNLKNFETEILEKSPRIKHNDKNHYRATHMQICLREEDLSKDDADTLRDSCELQITSMLAHVWNEIEHDTIYKEKSGKLSTEEKRAIHSLGLLTQSGDHIIQSLLASRNIREENEKRDSQIQNERFFDKDELSLFLLNHFGEKIGPVKMDFSIGAEDLLAGLHAVDWDHPNDIVTRFTPKILLETRKISKRIIAAQTKANRTKSLYRPGTCDLFFVSLCALDLSIAETAVEDLSGNSRASVLLKAFKQLS
ncbi:RelA/SpoT domain-containing protein [bacterium]|nr:RelA/SpoT domain-containing protein [bacterium]